MKTRLSPSKLCMVITCSLLLTSAASASVISVSAGKDTTILDNGRVNGTGQALFTGRTGSGVLRRGLLWFDLSGIAAGSVINSVTLSMYVNSLGSGASTDLHTVHRLQQDWNEAANGSGGATTGGGGGVTAVAGDATWTNSGYGAWAAGGNFNPAESDSLLIGTLGLQNFTGAGLVADVQDWVDNGNNFGWILIGNEQNNSSSKRFNAREHESGNYPTLTIDYTPVPVPAAVWLFGSGLLGLLAIARRKQ